MSNRIAAACGVAALLVGASACGSKDGDGASPTAEVTTGARTSQQGAQFPGADGKVAEVSGSTAQVQSQLNGQVAVTWTSSTTFTQEVAAKLVDVKVGDCVMVTPKQTSSSESSSGSSSDDTVVAAGTVRITAATGSTCTPQLRGPGGGDGPVTNGNGAPPTGAPPTGAPPAGAQQLRGSFGAFGKVTAVSAAGFTVSSVRPSGSGSGTTTTAVTVTTSSTTTYTTTAKATAADVKVGRCLNARGKTDSTGAVTATTVALSTPVDGECGGGFFRSRGNGPGTDTGSSTGSTGSGQES